MGHPSKYRPSVDLPAFALEYSTLQPSELVKIVLMKRNEKISDNSVTMWFKRNHQVYDQLAEKIVIKDFSKEEAINPSIYLNGSFEEIKSVKQWIRDMNSRSVKLRGMQRSIRYILRLCREGFEVPKHPDRLTLEECQDFISKLREKGLSDSQTKGWRCAIRDFLSSKGIVVKGKISGKKGQIGQYATLYYPEETLEKIMCEVDQINHELGLLDRFMHGNATRVDASLKASWDKVQEGKALATVQVLDKKDLIWTKAISLDLLEQLKKIRSPKSDKLFPHLNYVTCCEINRQVITRNVQVPKGFHNWNHFWRHMYAQRMLRRTDWNYDVVAQLGGWLDTATLKRCYGTAPPDVTASWLKKYSVEDQETPLLQVSV